MNEKNLKSYVSFNLEITFFFNTGLGLKDTMEIGTIMKEPVEESQISHYF